MRPTYLAVALFLISAMLSVMMGIAWRRFGKPPHALTWGVAFALSACMFALRIGVAPNDGHALLWLTVSSLGMVSAVFLTVGHRQRVGIKPGLGFLFGGWLVAMLALGYFTLISPHLGMQRGIGPGYATLVLALGIHALLQVDRRLTAIELSGICVLGALGLIQGASFLFAILQGPGGNESWMELYRDLRVLGLPAAHACVGIFLVFLLADDLASEMRQLAITDPLTGIFNRRGFEEAAEGEIARAIRRRQPLAIVIADIDRFKAINDAYGHASGDRALQAFVQLCRGTLCAQDLFARLGGEEFAIVLPDTTAEAALAKIEGLRADLRESGCVETGGGKLTASFGVAIREHDGESIGDILRRADQALYLSKSRGRDRATLYGEVLRPKVVRAA
jgi:diguanylate cyclase (GGDEF)-like protein